MSEEIHEAMARPQARRAAMPPAEREELERREYQAQRESWIRAMGPCEHGVLDWEQCTECRPPSNRRG